jgi:peptide-methionine (S)-S-oxide reductase
VEVLHIKFDPTKVQYEDLIRFFYQFHDPTTLDRQGNDAGVQVSSRWRSDEQA